jgi:CheY-like chemotaxis protein
MNDREFTILLIENDRELTTLLDKLLPSKLKPRKVTIIVKCHMEEARELLQTRFAELQALIVDIMLPRTKGELQQLERLETERRGMLRELKQCRTRTGTEAEKQIGLLRHQIDELDAQIEKVQDLEGGVHLLEEIVKERPRIDIPTVFFTARALPDLRRRAEALVKSGLSTWIQKPAPASAVVQALLTGTEG